jgi:hypothetical protein
VSEYAQFTCKVTYLYVCDYCGCVEEEVFLWREGNALLRPSQPYGWRKLNMKLVCPKHQIEVTDRG